jgi:hypothetical protein
MRFHAPPQVPFRTSHGVPLTASRRTDFYREEFLRHRACIEQQREHFSESTLADVECVIGKILARLDQVCACDEVDRQVSDWLRALDAVTFVSAWDDQRALH